MHTLATLGWKALTDLQQPQTLFVALLSVLIPLSIFVGRRNVRLRRLRMLQNLERVLLPPPAGGCVGQAPLPPGFAMIKARYLDDTDRARPWTRVLAWLGEIGIYALPTLVFVLVSGCGFALLFALGGQWLDAAKVLLQGLQAEGGGAASFATATALVMAAGFVGAYLWSVNYLILRVANFDLSPLSFLSTSAHILMTVFVAWVLRQVVAVPTAAEAVAVAVLLGIAFLSGLYPSLGLNVLVDRLPAWLRLKRDVPEASRIGRSFPLDLVDGIDTTVKFRLNELDVAEVQNLASANPVELFVETPYGFGQILDWMAQAQLLAELGPQRFLAARDAGVRDMVALLDLARSDTGRALLKPILAADGETDEVLRARAESVARKLHVRHLAHWAALLSRALEDPSSSAAGDAAAAGGGNVTPLKATG